MTMPPASFVAVAPPADGLAMAFAAARRRRNSKAAVSAFGGAVAIASVLSFLAPPGQTLVQEPAPPAHSDLLSGVAELPRHGAPAPAVGTPQAPTSSRSTIGSPVLVGMAALHPAGSVRPPASATDSCTDHRALACATLPHVVDGGPSMRAEVCPSSASVTVDYDSQPVGPTRLTGSRRVEVGDGCSS